MKLKKILISIVLTIVTLAGCNAQSAGFKSMEVVEFEQAIQDTNVIRLDVRTPNEYAAGHLEGAIVIDVLAKDFEEKACAILPKDKTIALYCRSGKRSKKAAAILVQQGYTVIELNTGYLGWTGAGKQVVR